jgi:hypothetical protein
MTCATCEQTTQHARLRDPGPESGWNYAELENYTRPLNVINGKPIRG